MGDGAEAHVYGNVFEDAVSLADEEGESVEGGFLGAPQLFPAPYIVARSVTVSRSPAGSVTRFVPYSSTRPSGEKTSKQSEKVSSEG